MLGILNEEDSVREVAYRYFKLAGDHGHPYGCHKVYKFHMTQSKIYTWYPSGGEETGVNYLIKGSEMVMTGEMSFLKNGPDLCKRELGKYYYEKAKKAFASMLKIAPKCVFDKDGIMQKGVILRHLVLPSLRKDSIKILEDVSINFDISKFKLALMCQYTPDFCNDEFKEIKRRVTTFEYNSVMEKAISIGYDGYIQDISSASKIYTPDFKKGNL